MFKDMDVFTKHYSDYCNQIAQIDFGSVANILGIRHDDDQLFISFFNSDYLVSTHGIVDSAGDRPEYMACVVVAKYILLCPDHVYYDNEWISLKDFRRTSHFTNLNIFTSDAEQAITKQFSGKLNELISAGIVLGGSHHEMEISYDLSMQFRVLPRLSLLLLFNDADEEFPAQCTILFQRHAEFYLDPESLIMTGILLARKLRGNMIA